MVTQKSNKTRNKPSTLTLDRRFKLSSTPRIPTRELQGLKAETDSMGLIHFTPKDRT